MLENRWFLLLVIALTWGSSFILIKKSLIVFSPYEIGAIRVAISGVIMAFWGIPALRKMPKNLLLWIALAGFFGNFLPMFLFPLAQTQVSSSLAGILDSLVPVFVLVLGYFLFGIRSKLIQGVGALVGFGGAATLMYFSEVSTEGSQLGYAMLVVIATACYAVSALLIKHKLQNVPSMKLSGAIFTIWMIPSLIILIAIGFFKNFQSSPEVWEAAGYLGILTVVGTTVGMILYYKLIQNTSPVFASSVTYLLPIVAVIWGLIDGESFTIWYVLGGLLILAGIYLIREKKKDPRPVARA